MGPKQGLRRGEAWWLGRQAVAALVWTGGPRGPLWTVRCLGRSTGAFTAVSLRLQGQEVGAQTRTDIALSFSGHRGHKRGERTSEVPVPLKKERPEARRFSGVGGPSHLAWNPLCPPQAAVV